MTGARNELDAACEGLDSPVAVARVNFTAWESIRLERVNWLMPDRLPLAELTIMEGDGGLGKTTAMLDIAARISRGGPMPDRSRPFDEPRPVLLVADEDRESILKARLIAAGADMAYVHHVSSIGEDRVRLSLPSHSKELLRAVQETGAVLALIDALFNHFDQGLKSGITEDVRRVLSPLSVIAHTTGSAIVPIRHWGKTARSAGSRGLGSIDITNIARSVLAVGRHPHDESGPRIIAVAKSNLGQDFTKVPALSFTLETAIVTEGGVDVSVGRVVWGDELEITAEQLANTTMQTAEESSETAQHARRIRELVDEAGDAGVPVSELRKALEQEGCSYATFFRAAKRAHVRSASGGFPRKARYFPASSLARAISAITDTTDITDTARSAVQSSQSSQSSQLYRVRANETADATTGSVAGTAATDVPGSSGQRLSGDRGMPAEWSSRHMVCARCHTLGIVRTSDQVCAECLDIRLGTAL